jgi:hypothetical protein
MLFDDSFEHEVWYWSHAQIHQSSNDTTAPATAATPLPSSSSMSTPSTSLTSVEMRRRMEVDPSLERVVLLFDFWNPLLTPVERDVLHRILPQVVPVEDK